MSETIDRLPELVPLELVAEHWRMDWRELRESWKTQQGSPRLIKRKRGRYLVDLGEVLDWVEESKVMNAEERAERLRRIRRAGSGPAVLQRHVLRNLSRQGTSG